ncbi:MAG: FAD-dependent oxidoreductase [Clostridiales bacterium]|nr:FAD-dependent oxidoreductase [Clostridiales bacterium]
MKTEILIIGGSAAGLVAATTAKSCNQGKGITLIRKEETVMIPCGIPYIFGSVMTSEKNILPDAGLHKLGVNIIVDEVTSINKEEKNCKTKKGEIIEYEKLIIATGSKPVKPEWLKGRDLKNVFVIPKDKEYLDSFHKQLENLHKIVIIGAGFIGIEVADELNKIGKDVTVVEILPRILGAAFDEVVANEAEQCLIDRGVKVNKGIGIKEILGTDKTEAVLLNNGEKIEADSVILSLGYVPNVELAKKAGLKLNEFGFIEVDQYRRTGEPDIFAIGDCSEKRDFATGRLSKTMLASTACAEARVAAMNLCKLSTVQTFRGTIGIYFTAIGDTAFGVAGLNKAVAIKEGFDVVTGSFTGIDRHPGKLEDSHKQMVKLIVARHNGLILGGEVIGGKSTGELTNVIGFMIQNNMTVNDVIVSQIGTHPLLTASPAGYPLIKAAEIVAKTLKS